MLPEFLGVTPGTKTIVIREMPDNSINYFIARGHDIFLGDPDVAADNANDSYQKAGDEPIETGYGSRRSRGSCRFAA